MMRKNLRTGCNHHHHNITKSDVRNHHHKKKKSSSMFMCLFSFSAIALGLLSLSILALTVNAQPYSPSPVSSTKSARSSTNGDAQMGICVVGAGGPCNGDRWLRNDFNQSVSSSFFKMIKLQRQPKSIEYIPCMMLLLCPMFHHYLQQFSMQLLVYQTCLNWWPFSHHLSQVSSKQRD